MGIRSGAQPVISRCAGRRERNAAMAARVRSVTKEIGTDMGDVAVLCLTRKAVAETSWALQSAGLPVVNLEDYTGVPTEAVKVG